MVLPLLFAAESIDPGNENGPNGLSIFSIVVMAPFLETTFNQYLPFKLMQAFSWTKNRYGIYMIGSALIFGLCHWYSIHYIISASAVGLILGYTYLFYSKTPKKAFWSATLIHAARNGLTVIIAYVPEFLN